MYRISDFFLANFAVAVFAEKLRSKQAEDETKKDGCLEFVATATGCFRGDAEACVKLAVAQGVSAGHELRRRSCGCQLLSPHFICVQGGV